MTLDDCRNYIWELRANCKFSFRLEFGYIYFSTNQIHITGGKNHQDHWTILSETSKDLLTQYWKSYPVKRQYVFVASKGKGERNRLKARGVEIMLGKVSDSIGLKDVTPHTLRHSFATHMVEQGESMEFIQAMMGHRDPASTHKYIHVANKSLMGIKSPLDASEKKKKGTKSLRRKKKDE